MQTVCPIELCTGCMACLNCCTHNAIHIFSDVCGFRYPYVVADLCVNCKLCEQVCPVNHQQEKRPPKFCYAVTIRGKDILTCASGGAATALSTFVLEKGGIVYGCSGRNMLHISHIRIADIRDLPLLKGSKYVQSEIGLIYRKVKEDLKQNILVLFIGTPCQIAGLKGFLKKDYHTLITADIVCHGVPSQRLLNDNIQYYQNKHNNRVELNNIRFRIINDNTDTKSLKIDYGFYFSLKDSSLSKNVDDEHSYDPYVWGFLKGLFLRRSCYVCSYACPSRVGDFTFADFWGIGDDTILEINNGVSLVLLNTEKAQLFFNEIKPKINFERRLVKEAIMGNGRLQAPTYCHKRYHLFRVLYPKCGLRFSVKVCLIRDFVKDKIKNSLK